MSNVSIKCHKCQMLGSQISTKQLFWKIRTFFRKTLYMLKFSLLKLQAHNFQLYCNKTSTWTFSSGFLEISQSSCFSERLRAIASKLFIYMIIPHNYNCFHQKMTSMITTENVYRKLSLSELQTFMRVLGRSWKTS